MGLKHFVRNLKNHGHRLLLLSDSMSAVMALSKGRSSAAGLTRICRQWAAYSLCCNVCVRCRWICSEWNPADAPSRRLRFGTIDWDPLGERARGAPGLTQDATSGGSAISAAPADDS